MANVIVTLDELTTRLNADLNSLSDTLYADGKISRNMQFNITPEMEEEGTKVYSEDVITQGSTEILNGSVTPSQNFGGYTYVVPFYLYAFNKDIRDLKIILNTYSIEYSGRITVINNWKTMEVIDIANIGQPVIDDGEDRIDTMMIINYGFSFNGVSSEDVTIKVDELELPILNFQSKMNKQGKTNELNNAGRKLTTLNETVSLTYNIDMRYIKDNQTMIEMMYDIKNINTTNTVNKIYSVTYDDGVVTDVLNMVITDGTVGYQNGTYLTVSAVFTEVMEGVI